MPLNVLRLNQEKNGATHPNERIVFIKALPGSTHDTAHDFLSRIAAQCLPLMKQHHLSVTTLEEHEPNREFVGRNFNAGEVIQLVLHPLRKDGGGERWLPFRYVQMVMMHELAHNAQMNHSKAFWAVRNVYANDMRGLWAKGYTGDGLWGRGQTLYSGQYADDQTPDAADLPEHLCGGTYRSRRKRKKGGGPKQQMSYQERKKRWIEKKFGAGGQSLGEDEMTRMMLENGKSTGSKPRVAGSKRGRELRAEAVAMRLRREENMRKHEKEAEEAIKREDEEEGTEEEGNIEMVRTCDDEDVDDEGAKNEMLELMQVGKTLQDSSLKKKHVPGRGAQAREEDVSTEEENEGEDSDDLDALPKRDRRARVSESKSKCKPKCKPDREPNSSKTILKPPNKNTVNRGPVPNTSAVDHKAEPPKESSIHESDKDQSRSLSKGDVSIVNASLALETGSIACPVCSFENDRMALTCGACANVLDTTRMPLHWRCVSEVCRDSVYVNSTDVGRCGLCGQAKPAE